MSPSNATVVRSLWETRPDRGSVQGITGFRFDPAATAENSFLENLDAVDLHHGRHSTTTPYTELQAVGVPLTAAIRKVLSSLGFGQFKEVNEGFVATRTEDQANRLRD
jgi:hypothetical protein